MLKKWVVVLIAGVLTGCAPEETGPVSPSAIEKKTPVSVVEKKTPVFRPPVHAPPAPVLMGAPVPVEPDADGFVFLEFEGNGLPEGLEIMASEASLDAARRVRGSQSLRWDWQGGAELKFNLPVACDPSLNGRDHKKSSSETRCFKFWMYNEVPMPGKQVNIFFGDAQGEPCSFPFNLGFSGWRTAWIAFARDMQGAPDRDLSYVRFVAPEGAGTFWIDDLAPALSIDARHQAPDHQVPFVHADKQDLLHAPPHVPNILIDAKINPQGEGFALTDRELAGFRAIEQALLESYPPTKTDRPRLVEEFEKYGIEKDAHGVVRGAYLPHLGSRAHAAGFPPRLQAQINAMSKKNDFSAYTELMLRIARAYQTEKPEPLKTMFLLMAEHLLDLGWQEGSAQGTLHHFGYASRAWPPAMFLMRDELAEAGLLEPTADALIWFFNVKKHFLPPQPHLADMDYLNTTAFSELIAIATLPDSPRKVEYFEAFRNSFSSILELPSPGTQGGIKSDGSLYHHRMHYHGYGIPGIAGATRLFSTLEGTPYALSPGARRVLENAHLRAQLWGDPWSGFNACGRHPLVQGSKQVHAGAKRLSLDLPENPQGAWCMPYQSCGIYKHRNSHVLIKGYGSGVRSHETYGTDNRYGSYGSHGTIQIFNNTRTHPSGFTEPGWNWSQPPGATTLALPLDVLEGGTGFYGRKVSQSAPFGGASHLDNEIGLFGFQLDHGPKRDAQSIQVRKSVLAIDGKLVCLGSNLSSNSDYPLVTTLFQCGLGEGHSELKRGMSWIIDPYGTGHWLAPGCKPKLSVGKQTSKHNKTRKPTEGEFAMAWIDHGKGAKDATYEYVSVLGADEKTMKALASQQPFYSVERSTAATHAFVVPGQKVLALVNFQPLEEVLGLFLSINQPSLVLLKQQDGGSLRISVSDPRLELTNTTTAPPSDVVLKIKGSYELAETTEGVRANVVQGGTEIVVRCSEGMPTTFTLKGQ